MLIVKVEGSSSALASRAAAMDSGAMDARNREVELVHALAKTLGCAVDRQMLSICLELIEYGVDPESLADGECGNAANAPSRLFCDGLVGPQGTSLLCSI